MKRILANLAWLLAGSACVAQPTIGGQLPNFVFILADDLGWHQLGCYGSEYYETPRLDRMAKEGMRFTDAYAAAPVCSPTRGSVMTGKYPARTHLTVNIPTDRNLEKTRDYTGVRRMAPS